MGSRHYLYDGSNVVQELSGSTPSANLLSGSQDEVFTRTDSSGVADFIRDGIGSTAELTDSTGAALQSYTYSPNGFTSTNGGSANGYQYIGRETDATGLYYFRNRYYDPITERFLSEDPMGLAGGPNLYEYGADNPTTYSDPNGKFVEGCLIGVAMYEWNQIGQGLAGRKMNTGWNDAKAAAQACAIGFFTDGLGELALEGAGAAAGAYADGLEGLGPDASEVPQILQNAAKGRAFEKAALDALGATKNTTLLSADDLGTSIPDVIDENGNVTEIKNVVNLSFTNQLQIQAQAAEGSFNLIVSPSTQYISQPLQDAVYGSGGTIQIFDPTTGAFTSW